MATISSTISLVDDISSKLIAIKGHVDEVVASLEAMQSGLDSGQTAANAFSWDTFTRNCEAAARIVSDMSDQMTLALAAPFGFLEKGLYGTATGRKSALTKTRPISYDSAAESPKWQDRIRRFPPGASDTTWLEEPQTIVRQYELTAAFHRPESMPDPFEGFITPVLQSDLDMESLDFAGIQSAIDAAAKPLDLTKIQRAIDGAARPLDLGGLQDAIDSAAKPLDLGEFQDAINRAEKPLDLGGLQDAIDRAAKPLDLGGLQDAIGRAAKPLDLGELQKAIDSAEKPLDLGGLQDAIDIAAKPLDLGELQDAIDSAAKPLDVGKLQDAIDSGARPLDVGKLQDAIDSAEKPIDLGGLQDAIDSAAKPLDLGGLQDAIDRAEKPLDLEGLQDAIDRAAKPLDVGKLQGAMDSAFESLDVEELQAVLDSVMEPLDFTQAAQKAIEDGAPFLTGEDLAQNLTDGMADLAATVAPGASAMGTAIATSLQAALDASALPAYAQGQGMLVDLGLAQGVLENMGAATDAVNAMGASAVAAMAAVCNRIVAMGNSIVNYGAGYAMGRNIGLGLAAGIRSQIGAVQAAASAMASAAASAAQTRLAIHSPSRVFYGFGEMSGRGYINALDDMGHDVQRAVGRLLDIEYKAANKDVWSEIQLFGGYEMEDLMNANNEDYEMKVSDSDMKKIRELAEREVINQFTTAELHIDFTANNRIESDLDLDGVVSYLEDQVAERLEMVAEGVYA